MSFDPDISTIENDANEVSEARIKLDDLLNEIVDRNEDEPSSDEEGYAKKITGNLQVHTPTKRTFPGRAPRRKKRKDPYEEDFMMSNKPSYVIKVFDRRVNLAKFSSQTPLYVMLREWMKNKPYSSWSSISDEDRASYSMADEDGVVPFKDLEETYLVEDSKIYQLPKPMKGEESGCPDLPRVLKTALVENTMDTKDDINDLKKENILRWRKVKNRWKEHSFRQQKRHLESVVMLKSAMKNQVENMTK